MRLVHALPPSFDGPLASVPKFEVVIEHDRDNHSSRPVTPAMSTFSRYSAWWVDEDDAHARSASPAPSSHYTTSPSPLPIRRSHSLLSRMTHLHHAGSRTLSSPSVASLASHQRLSSGNPTCPYHGGYSLLSSDIHSLPGRSQLPETTWCSPPTDRPTYMPVSQLRDMYTPSASANALTGQTVDLSDEPDQAGGALSEGTYERGSAYEPSLRSCPPGAHCSPAEDRWADSIAAMAPKMREDGQCTKNACTCSEYAAADTNEVFATSSTLCPPSLPARSKPRQTRKKWLACLQRAPKGFSDCGPCDTARLSPSRPADPRSLLRKRRKPRNGAEDGAGSRWCDIRKKMKRLVKVLSVRPHVKDTGV